MGNPMAENAVRYALEPLRRQSHDEYRGGRNNPAQNHYAVGGHFLGEGSHNGNKNYDQDTVDSPEPSHGRSVAQFTNAERWKHIVHLHEYQFQKGDQQEEG